MRQVIAGIALGYLVGELSKATPNVFGVVMCIVIIVIALLYSTVKNNRGEQSGCE